MFRALPTESQGFLPVGLALAFTDEEHLRPNKLNTVDRFLLDRDEGILQLFVQYALSVAGAADREKAHRDFFDNYGSDSSLPTHVYEAEIDHGLVPEVKGALVPGVGDVTKLDDEEEGASDDEEGAISTIVTAITNTTTSSSLAPSIALALSAPPASPRTLALIREADTVHGLGPARKNGALLAKTSIFDLKPITESRSKTLARKKAEAASAAANGENEKEKLRGMKRKAGGKKGMVLASVKRQRRNVVIAVSDDDDEGNNEDECNNEYYNEYDDDDDDDGVNGDNDDGDDGDWQE